MNKKQQKFVAFIVLFLFLFGTLMSFCSCREENVVTSTKPLNIVTTFFAPYDFVRSIVAEDADITMLLKPGAEVHSYEPTPQDLIQIQNADIFIYTGGENDTWVDSILESLQTNHVQVIRMLDLVKLYEEDALSESFEDTSEEPEWDEHVWTDPRNAALITEAISETCVQLLEDKGLTQQAVATKQRTEAYIAELNILHEAFLEVVNGSKNNVLVVADRFPFRYFVEAYNLEYIAAFPGCSTESETSASKLAGMIDYVKEHHIQIIYTVELSNQSMANTICEDTGCDKRIFYSCQNISRDDFFAGETYLSLMYKNVESLKEALHS